MNYVAMTMIVASVMAALVCIVVSGEVLTISAAFCGMTAGVYSRILYEDRRWQKRGDS